MAQFPSVKARRKTSKGYGLRHEFPEPAAHDLVSPAEAFVTNPPRGDVLWQASMLKRFKNYAPEYAAIDGRYGGPLRWRVAPTPVEYCIGPMDDSFIRLALAYLDALKNNNIVELYSPGQTYVDANNANQFWTVETVTPNYTLDDEKSQIYAYTQTTVDWIADSGADFANVLLGHPAQTVHSISTDGRTETFVVPARSNLQDGGATMADGRDGLLECMINLVLWGHCEGPVTIGSPKGNFIGIQLPGFASGAWLDWLGRCAGRVLWQMAHVETLLMLTDICNVGTRGHGGTAGRGGTTLVGPVTPNASPVLPRSTWSKVAPYVDKAIAGAIEAGTAALISTL